MTTVTRSGPISLSEDFDLSSRRYNAYHNEKPRGESYVKIAFNKLNIISKFEISGTV